MSRRSTASATVIAILTAALALGACSNIGNMFGSSGPEQPFDTVDAPDTKELLDSRPKGLLPDRENVRHSGQTIQPQ